MNDVDYLVYSSHKTSTQTLCHSLMNHNYNVVHIHHLCNRNLNKEQFLSQLVDYNQYNMKKLNIVSVIRNPNDRILSSFFQSYHTDELITRGVTEDNTTISVNNCEQIFNIYKDFSMGNSNQEDAESLSEMSYIFDINIIKNLRSINNNEYYYFENDLIKLYVLNFNKVINDINYVNNCLSISLPELISRNKSDDKYYYSKYQVLKEYVKNDGEINKFIENCYYKNYNFYYNFLL